MKFDVAVVTLRNLLNMAALGEHQNKANIEKVGYTF